MDIVIYVSALAFATMGVGALLAPGAVPRLFGITGINADMASEVRAVYGGFGCAMAGLLVVASQHPPLKAGIVVTIGIALLGMAAGRLVSASITRTVGFYPGLFLLIEIVFGGLLLWAADYHGPA